MSDHRLDPRFIAGVQLLERVGARDFTIGHTSPEDNEPDLWWAHVTLRFTGGHRECAASIDPIEAVMRLCAQLVDGGTCTHCARPTMFEAHVPLGDVLDIIAARAMCVYAWDPELATFRRGCEGDK